MVAHTHRPRSPRHLVGSARPARRLHGRLGALTTAAALLVGASACGLEVQTSQPYTPADGINRDVGTVAVRNVLIISRAAGSGILSASMVSSAQDSLTGVSGNAVKSDGSAGSALTASLSSPVALQPDTSVVLTDQPTLVTISSADLAPGLTANLTLTFAQSGTLQVVVPVMDGSQPPFTSISPTPAPAATPSA